MRTTWVIAAAVICLYLVGQWLTRAWYGRERLRMLERITNRFSFLESEYGLTCVSRTYDAQVFGNIVVRYEKPGLSFQLVRDRSQWFFEMGTPELGFFSETDLLPRCGAADDLNAMISADWRSLELVADIVQRRFTGLEAQLGSDETKRLAADRKRQRDESLCDVLGKGRGDRGA